MRSATLLVLLVAALWGGNLLAASAPSVKDGAKRPIDYLGNWLVNQFDAKEKIFGAGDDARDTLQTAMVVATLLNNRRDYKESNGPFISEPVKYVLGKIKDDGSVDGTKNAGEAQLWVVWMLESTKNKAYADKLAKCKEKLAGMDNPLKTAPKLEKTEQLSPAIETKALYDTLLAITPLTSADATVGGQPVNWAETITTNLLKAQKKNGSFSDDIRVNALVHQVLSVCYKQLK